MSFAVFHFDSMLCWRVVFHPPLISDSHKVPSSRTQPLRLLQLTQAGAVYSLQVCTQDYTVFKRTRASCDDPPWPIPDNCRRRGRRRQCKFFWQV